MYLIDGLLVLSAVCGVGHRTSLYSQLVFLSILLLVSKASKDCRSSIRAESSGTTTTTFTLQSELRIATNYITLRVLTDCADNADASRVASERHSSNSSHSVIECSIKT